MATTKIQFEVQGMHCGACATSIQMLLSMQEGVTKASVDYDSKKGEVEYDPEKVKIEDLFKTVEEIGYKITKI
ncbi:MAG: Copper-translocating P-type ATPase CopA [Candidatus Azambacteria bacterium GW2011_GWB2_46_37]|uniref:Heavy metal translocating P-type atpase, Cu2+-exporting ATPase n=3 Tax=Candidatus Azamiibacteriota TaxID=1752741 RepID=A0A0G1NKM5_9BACT|nr:MAG: heavy metal translocating p-type atpase, Cu2+-exporting ATPase [Candidatus Azambacteria bacterium GW2011_GWC1_46_13]KKU37305.1 MAG: Copper-translocating P-type ATPase CopA [Candidatus Azambacteria bacterium GW2011_GWF2_46_32]KKU38187.1 MAG: Copper-translocating P-type ATPase CopA [Candidatus Azambacteria bacterium GW2011_GWB2_46_37]HAQ05493.1 hypothetical protein [Candidatus Azambacteria bacterium]